MLKRRCTLTFALRLSVCDASMSNLQGTTMEDDSSVKSVHRVLARELTPDEISEVGGGECTYYWQTYCSDYNCGELTSVKVCYDQST